jgi:hypothetical protein
MIRRIMMRLSSVICLREGEGRSLCPFLCSTTWPRVVEVDVSDFASIGLLDFEAKPARAFCVHPNAFDSVSPRRQDRPPNDCLSPRRASRKLSGENCHPRPLKLAPSNCPARPRHRIMNHVAEGTGVLWEPTVTCPLGEGKQRRMFRGHVTSNLALRPLVGTIAADHCPSSERDRKLKWPSQGLFPLLRTRLGSGPATARQPSSDSKPEA